MTTRTNRGDKEAAPTKRQNPDAEIIDQVDKSFAKLGYTNPGQALNVATAKSLARNAAFEARVAAEKAMYQRCCGLCQSRIERERGGVF